MTRVSMNQFPAWQRDVLGVVARLAPEAGIHVVGGSIRDVLLERASVDLDLAMPVGSVALARRLARETRGTFVELDPERGTARVVLPAPAENARIDVCDFRGPTLDDDLRRRDFSVDALAVPLVPLVEGGSAPITDPTGGLADLAARGLRPAGPGVIQSDPLRALRGLRLEAQLGFRLAPGVGRIIRRVAPALAQVAVERVTQELIEILRTDRSAAALRRADRLGILTAFLPEVGPMRGVGQPEPHRFDVLEHSLRAVSATDQLLGGLSRRLPRGADLVRHLAEPLGGGITRREVLKLAALLHDVAKPETRAVVEDRIRFFGHDHIGAARVRAAGERLRLPARAIRLLETLVRHHLRVMHLAQAGTVTRRARYRFFRDLGDAAQDLLLLALVDAAALNGRSPFGVWQRSALVRDLMAGWRDESAARSSPPLLRGEDVMTAFGLAAGPEVGRMLARSREAQDLGLVSTRDQALAYLQEDRARCATPESAGAGATGATGGC